MYVCASKHVWMRVCVCVWRTVCETREGWQLNSELTHDSTTSTHSVLYTAALTEPNSHFILIPLSFSLCASLHRSLACSPLHPSLPPSSITHPSLLNLLSSLHLLPSICLYFSQPLPSTHLFQCVHFYAISYHWQVVRLLFQTFGLLTQLIAVAA